jgi:hypothetical protein
VSIRCGPKHGDYIQKSERDKRAYWNFSTSSFKLISSQRQLEFPLKIKGVFTNSREFSYKLLDRKKETQWLKESLRINLLSYNITMAHKAVLVFVIFTITREACAFLPLLQPGGGSGRSGKNLLRPGKWFSFSSRKQERIRNGLGQTWTATFPQKLNKFSITF